MLLTIARTLGRLLACRLLHAHQWHLIAGVPIIRPADAGHRQLHMCTRCYTTTVTHSRVPQVTPRPPAA